MRHLHADGMVPLHDDSLTLRDARGLYFARNGFGTDGGHDARWVTLKAGPVPIVFPNTAGRVRAVRFHDLHHVVTGYDTTWTGEAEIVAWELASGCAHHVAAWILNLEGLAIGLAIAPRRVFAAFTRGRRTRNLYRETYGDALLHETVGTMRTRTGLDASPPTPTPRDRVAFAAWSVVGVVVLAVATAVAVGWPVVAGVLAWRWWGATPMELP